MYYGLGLLSTGCYRQVLDAAGWADTLGLVNFALPDHYLDESPEGRPTLDAFAVLSGLARETAGLRVSYSSAVVAGRNGKEYRRRLAEAARREGTDAGEFEARLVRRNTLHGTYPEVEERLGLLEEVGVSRFYIQRRPDADLGKTGEILEGIGFRPGGSTR